jgi:ABC-type branched-subunit amino acid transport system ATPase component
MNLEETAEMVGLINKIRDRGITLILIEHDMKVVMGICDKITVINFGMKIAEGSPEKIQNDERVHEAYLGGEIYAA